MENPNESLSLEDRVIAAFAVLRQEKQRLNYLQQTDTSRYESPMLYAHHRDLMIAQTRFDQAKLLIDELRWIILARLADRFPENVLEMNYGEDEN